MDQRILDFEKQFHKTKLPDIHPGDTVRVHQRIYEGGPVASPAVAKDSDQRRSANSGQAGKTRIHQFEGVVIAMKHGKGMSGSFTVRKIGAQGVGVETTFFWHAPTLFKVERIRAGDVRRAKLYYMRNLSAKASRKLRGAQVGDIWEETASNAVRAALSATVDNKNKESAPDVPQIETEQAAQTLESQESAETQEASGRGHGEKSEKTDEASRESGGAAGGGSSEKAGIPDSGHESKP